MGGIMTKEISKEMTIQGLLVNYKNQISLALPKHMNADRMARIALTIIRKNDALKECNPVSLFGAIIQASQLGLEIGIHAHLVPFYNKKTKSKEVQMIPDYRGLMHLARNSGDISTFMASVVYENDKFDYQFGSASFLHHKPAKTDRGNIIGAYAVAKYKGSDDSQFDYMTKDEIDAIRGRSPAKDNGPWVTDYVPMAMKTATKRLCKYLPVSIELQKAVSMDELNDIGESQGNIAILDHELGEQPTGKPTVAMPEPQKNETTTN
jgi:recombination protein RecT